MKLKLKGHQGDVCIYTIDQLPEGERIQTKQTKEQVLAYGELSGHCHKLHSDNVEMFTSNDPKNTGLIFFELKEEAKITHGRIEGFTGTEPDHDYHHPITLAPGMYVTGVVKETDWLTKTIRRVVD
jgi:hypothetical protein